MEDYINESAESQEVAEPETDDVASAESQEVAEPESTESHEEVKDTGKTEMDSAFAEMRRSNQQLERENKMMMDALLRYFDGDTAEELSINANAYAEQRDPDEYRQEWEHLQEFDKVKAENEELKEQLLSAQVDRLMREGLREVQEIDPNVKSLEDLGSNFVKFIGNGLTTKEAYYASKAMELKEKVLAPDVIGKVADTKAERDYYTSEEIDNLTDEELNDDRIWAKVMKSMERW